MGALLGGVEHRQRPQHTVGAKKLKDDFELGAVEAENLADISWYVCVVAAVVVVVLIYSTAKPR